MTRDRLVARIATGSIGVCVLIVIGTLAFPFVRSAVGAPVARAGYAVGDRLDVPAGVYDRHAYTVVIFARSGCGVCQQMKPALARVTAAAAALPSMGVAVIAPDSNPPAEAQFAREIAVGVTPTLLDLSRLRLQMVPALMVVDRRGDVQFVRAGGGWSAADEADVVRAIQTVGEGR